MDYGSSQAVRVLEALAEASFALRDFGYRAYLSRKGTWGSSNLVISGSPFHRYDERFTRSLSMGVWIGLAVGRSLIWSLNLLWDEDRWTIHAEIELESEED